MSTQDERELEGMVFVVTGGARGIGAATARAAARRGASVMITDVIDEDGEGVAAGIRDGGGQAFYQRCDLAEEEQIASLMAATVDTFGGIDVVHNNAGVHESQLAGAEIGLDTLGIETFRKVLAINLEAPFLTAKHALPHLRASANASIINAGSAASELGYPGCIAYGSSKGGIALLSKNLAIAVAPDGIRVNCYCPDNIRTRMVMDYVDAAPDRDAFLAGLASTHLIHRLGEPEEVAELVCFLAGARSSYINGAVIPVDGGSLAWRGTVDQIGMA